MAVKTEYISVSTRGNRDVIDLTPDVKRILAESGVRNGIVTVFVPGSTAAVTTVEYEPGLKKDIDTYLNRLFPYGEKYMHHETWHDDNGSAHLQAAVIGPSLTVPFLEGEPVLGTWQQIVVIDCDTRPRNRKILFQLVF